MTAEIKRRIFRFSLLTFFSFSFQVIAGKYVYIFIYLTKCSEIMSSMMEQKIFCVKTYYETKPLKLFKKDAERSSFSTHFQKSQIFKLVQNFEAHRVIGSWPSGSPAIKEECACFINNFAWCIQKCLQLNSGRLELFLTFLVHVWD